MATVASRSLESTRVSVASPSTRRPPRLGLYVLVIVIALWSLFPLFYMLNLSLMTTAEVLEKPPRAIAFPPRLESWFLVLIGQKDLYKEYGGFEAGVTAHRIPGAMWNSFQVALGTTLLNLLFGSFAGYAYARHLRFRFMKATLVMLMLTRMLPGLALLIPFFILYRQLGLIDTKIGLIIAYTSFLLPLTTWIMTGYFSTIPRSLEWAARVDGCNWFQAFRRIFLPVSAPGLMAAGIFAFLVAWNEFLFALILTSTPATQTSTVAIAGLASTMRHRLDDYPALFVGGFIAVLPPLLIAFLLQRYLIQGMLSGASKG